MARGTKPTGAEMARPEAGCLCGKVRFAVSADPMRVTLPLSFLPAQYRHRVPGRADGREGVTG
jgi:hypothetical protein